MPPPAQTVRESTKLHKTESVACLISYLKGILNVHACITVQQQQQKLGLADFDY